MTQDTERKILNFPDQGANKPEQAGPEFYAAGSRPEQPFRPDYERNKHADAVPEMVKPDETHTEALIRLPKAIPETQHKVELTRLISPSETIKKLQAEGSSGRLHANQLSEQSIETWRKNQAAKF